MAVDEVTGSELARRISAVTWARRLSPVLPMPIDALLRLAAVLMDAPMAMMTLATERDEEYVLLTHGLPAAVSPDTTAFRGTTMTGVVLAADHPIRCPDLRADTALCDHPLLTASGARALLAVPLRDATDTPVGALCVLDVAAREWSDGQLSTLIEIAHLLGPLPLDEVGAATTALAALESASVLDGILEAFVACTGSGFVVGWNHAAEEMFGWTAEETHGRHVDDLGPPLYEGRTATEMLPVILSDPDAWRAPRLVSVRHRSGRRFPVRLRLMVVQSPAGALVCTFATDATAQVDAERHAAREGRFSAALVESMQAGVAACDQDGRLLLVNRALREIHGVPPDKEPIDLRTAKGTEIENLFHPDGRRMQIPDTPLLRALEGETVTGAQVMVRLPEGQPRYLEANARPVEAEDGLRLGAVVVLQDVTDRRRAERFRECELRVAQALAVATSAQDVGPALTAAVAGALGWPHVQLWLVDEVADILRSAGRWTRPGLDMDEFLPQEIARGWGFTGLVWETGRPLWIPDLLNPPVPVTPDVRARLRSAAAAGLRAALVIPVNSGRTTIGVLTCNANHREEDAESLIDLLTGIAAQVGHFIERRRADDLALELARTKDDFLALVGHEMRTPLTSIASYAELLAGGADAWPESDRQLLDVITRNTGVLRAIIDDLLDLTALESGSLTIHPEPLDLVTVITDSLTAVSPAAANNAVTLRTDLPDHLPLTGDPHRLRQIADNLLTNAVKYSPDGGNVYVGLAGDAGAAEFTVRDEGIGIPSEELHQLFRRFYRASTARHRGIPGTGLGLSITRALTEAHGGTITVTAPPSGGTTVSVRLPLKSMQS
ncbi:ATP-binding protein [Cryptosporangium aurantiacum]|uniref:histidine kinase n=1 Tax=Cryptosporangium aurantiacum TaxID=134849 RepID=A0A1M7RP56_9ACTN|nr:ATP-binding protein [Cryptosporangium aurantiacum]SHN48083.1 PAS domain S-box-containing protein [Cryptosporangium aurantiacum]